MASLTATASSRTWDRPSASCSTASSTSLMDVRKPTGTSWSTPWVRPSKQLHYQAQKNFGDFTNAALFQAVLRAARGTQDALRHDDAVPYAMFTPGDGGLALQRDNWIAMDIPAKLAYMRNSPGPCH